MLRARYFQASMVAGLACVLAGLPGPALGQGMSAQLNPGVSSTSTTTTDETGNSSRTDGTLWLQKYRLSLDEQVYPLVRANASALLDWTSGSAVTDGLSGSIDDKRWLVNGGVRVGAAPLSGAVDFDYRTEHSVSSRGGVTSTGPDINRLGLGGYVGWMPADLPTLELRLGHTETYDQARAVMDLSTTDAALASRYLPDPTVQLQYGLRASRAQDHRAGVTTDDVANSLSATWSDHLAGDRVTTFVSYDLSTRASDTVVSGAGGTVLTRKFPVAGLSIVESVTTTPDRVTLNPNAQLIDGDTAGNAGLNLGTSASAAGTGQPRELGAQLANLITPVNTLYLWVDRSVASVATLFTFSVWQSDDNITWTAVVDPLPAGQVEFSQVPGQYYFKLSLVQAAQARYLKVVTRPLPVSATIDPLLADIWVTELQLFQAQPADLVAGRSFYVAGNLNASLRWRLSDSPSLAWDSSLNLTHSNIGVGATWSLMNGLSWTRRLSSSAVATARIDRSDSDYGKGHEASTRWSASITASPMATLGTGASYGGIWTRGLTGSSLNNSLAAFVRADLYEGIAVNANASASAGDTVTGQLQRGSTMSASASLMPNRWFSLSGSALLAWSAASGGGLPDSSDIRNGFELAATFVPIPALTMTGGYSQYTIKGAPQSLANWLIALAPFQGGTLLIRYGYQETLDITGDTQTRSQGPNLRWNIRPGWFFDLTWSSVDITTPAARISTDGLYANLMINWH